MEVESIIENYCATWELAVNDAEEFKKGPRVLSFSYLREEFAVIYPQCTEHTYSLSSRFLENERIAILWRISFLILVPR